MNNILTGFTEKQNWLLSPPPLQGRIDYLGTGSKKYGVYVKDYYINEGRVYYNKVYIGKVINEDKGLFHHKGLGGYFTFSLSNGFARAEEPEVYAGKAEPEISLEFGDVWLFDQTCKQLGLDRVLESINPEISDSLKAMVAFRLLNNSDACCHAADWYNSSYARVLYPEARLESPRISEFNAYIGREDNYIKFFTNYLEVITKNKSISEQISIPILIDSTGLGNRIKTHLTAVNNHHGKISEEMRLIYIVDKETKTPIYFRIVPGNIIDNFTLITTLNMLDAYGIKIELIIMDAGYCSEHNLVELIKNGIPFLTRMIKNRIEYKKLINEESIDLYNGRYVVKYHDRSLFCKKVKFNIFNTELFAYIFIDENEHHNDVNNAIDKYYYDDKDNDRYDKICDEMFKAGKFILLSSIDCKTTEILPLYYTRQAIEQVFDIGKTYTGFLPLRGHSEETLRGSILISFIATAVYSCLSIRLADSKYSPHEALRSLRHAHIKVQESRTLLNELNSQNKDIFSILNINCPFAVIERGNLLQKPPLKLADGKRKRGRPAGNSGKPGAAPSEAGDAGVSLKGKRGRPRGSKNKPKLAAEAVEISQNPEGKRQRGRPKGSRNKPKLSNDGFEANKNSGEKRQRGRPKGSKNQAKSVQAA
jgi:hypothetical protein